MHFDISIPTFPTISRVESLQWRTANGQASSSFRLSVCHSAGHLGRPHSSCAACAPCVQLAHAAAQVTRWSPWTSQVKHLKLPGRSFFIDKESHWVILAVTSPGWDIINWRRPSVHTVLSSYMSCLGKCTRWYNSTRCVSEARKIASPSGFGHLRRH